MSIIIKAKFKVHCLVACESIISHVVRLHEKQKSFWNYKLSQFACCTIKRQYIIVWDLEIRDIHIAGKLSSFN